MSGTKTLAYITAFIPFGKIESFVLEESWSMKRIHSNFLLIPRNPPKEVFHQKAKDLKEDAVWLPLLNTAILVYFLGALLHPKTWAVIGSIIRHSRNLNMRMKNVAVLPKALYVANLLKKKNVGHVHAHWASTTATMAYIIHQVTGIPFSFTLHRWDIYENNMLKEKVRAASFARCISAKGKTDVLAIVGQELDSKVRVIHMGVELPVMPLRNTPQDPFVILTPANLLPVKGHRYLIDACRDLKLKGHNVQCWIAGDGPLAGELKTQVNNNGLEQQVVFLGRLPHEKILEMYQQKKIDVVILPSVNSDEGESEGIPVALMEAMSYGIPTIATDTGAIAELLDGGCGMLIKEKNSAAMADAVERLIKDRAYYEEIRMRGRQKIEQEFDLVKISVILLGLYGL